MDFAEVKEIVTEEALRPQVARALKSVPCQRCKSRGPHNVDVLPTEFRLKCGGCGAESQLPVDSLVALADALRPKIPFVPPMD